MLNDYPLFQNVSLIGKIISYSSGVVFLVYFQPTENRVLFFVLVLHQTNKNRVLFFALLFRIYFWFYTRIITPGKARRTVCHVGAGTQVDCMQGKNLSGCTLSPNQEWIFKQTFDIRWLQTLEKHFLHSLGHKLFYSVLCRGPRLVTLSTQNHSLLDSTFI